VRNLTEVGATLAAALRPRMAETLRCTGEASATRASTRGDGFGHHRDRETSKRTKARRAAAPTHVNRVAGVTDARSDQSSEAEARHCVAAQRQESRVRREVAPLTVAEKALKARKPMGGSGAKQRHDALAGSIR